MSLLVCSLENCCYYLAVVQVLFREYLSCMDLDIHAHEAAALLPVGSMRNHRGPFWFFIFDPFYSQSVIRDCPPNCNQNESTTLLTHDCKWWMEIIVPFSFVFHVQLAPPPITPLPRISKTFLLECLGRDLKREQSWHVEVKGKRNCSALVHTCTHLW